MTMKHIAGPNDWPRLPPLEGWQDTCTTLNMWAQVVGKIRLTLSPDINHSWGSTLYVTTRGLTTSPIPYGMFTFAIDFDFISHALHITTSQGNDRSFALEPMSVANFYRKTMQALAELGIEVRIFTRPVEVEVAIPFEKDEQHASYDANAASLFWHALVQTDCVFKDFRARFIGKVSPVHFFWGGIDLAVTRFSGRTAPKHPGGFPNVADRITQEAYSHEVSSAGFWPGTGLGEAAFYSYAYPSPAGFNDYPVQPEAAYFHGKLGEFILPYEAVRTAANPPQTLLSFLQTTYEAAATLGDWDRSALEREIAPA
ncbi:DUF5996 family protein [Nitrosovibrio sp. Nv6]|uniref:DUF5996 family protein n=1 Tax=Nitrosovibrio sp. Nv6 TaxID=1855340 RepID=UPI0008BDBC8B|nr:DUF5996 family protein [Nitrosovibrio sp. Nv6]SEO41120.1 hypothetical protein SAMN05216316_0153 [Nitrosovibrio sp. Nv6]